MPILSGIFNTTTTYQPAELNKRSFADMILRLFPNGSAPLYALSAKMGKKKAVSSTHGYFSKTWSFVTTTSTSGDTSVATTLTVGSTAGMFANQVLTIITTASTLWENVKVVSITNATQVVVVRGFGRVAGQTVPSGARIVGTGSAFAEGSTRPGARAQKSVYIPNYTQIFRNAWGLTDTARASMTEVAGYANVSENRKDCALFHSIDMEAAIIYWQPQMDTSGAQPVHTTQGIIDAMMQYTDGASNDNVVQAASTTNYSQLITLVEAPFFWSTDAGSSNERVGFCDRKAMKVLTDVGRNSGQIQIMTSETSFGMKFTSFQFYGGVINLVQHPLMNGLDAAGGNLLIVDLSAVKLAFLEGRDAVPEEYGVGMKQVELGTDGVGGSLTSEFAVELINPYACGYVKGLTAYGA